MASTNRLRTYCCVYGCLENSRKNPELAFFRIPTEPNKRKQWLQLISREDLMDKTSINRVCEIHFKPQDIQKQNRKTLNKNALPCFHLPEESTRIKNKETQTPFTVKNDSTQTDEGDNCTSETTASLDMPRKKQNIDAIACRLKALEQKGTKAQYDIFQKLCDRFLSNDLAELLKAQTNETIDKGLRHRNTHEFKEFCLSLFYSNPKAYRLLQKNIRLPSKRTLCKMIKISTKINDTIIEALKTKVSNMSDAEKQCTLVVDAMRLKTNLFYDINNDKIIGFHEIDGMQSPTPAKYALVVIVQGIFVKWSQPVAFALTSCKNDENIPKWIDKLLLKLIDTGLRVRAYVSDLNLSNGAKRGVSTDKTYFTINGHKIYYIFDAPHLLKQVQNNFSTNDFHFKNGVAKFEHILKFYEYDQTKTFKQATKLTKSHINPSDIEKTKVSYAAQMLSRSVASGLSTYIDFKVIEDSAKHTVKFIKIMNDLFDALNSSTFRHCYKHKNAFQGNEDQIDFFNSMLSFFKTVQLINPMTKADGTKSAEFIQGFQITIQSILLLHEDLKQEGYDSLLTRRLNLETIDNFFRKIRMENGKATEPTSRQFISIYSKLFFAKLNLPPKQSNHDENLTEFLVKLDDFETSLTNRRHVSPTVKERDNLREILRMDYKEFDIPEKNAFLCVCEALLKKCFDKHKDCVLLKKYMDVQDQACSTSVKSEHLSYSNYSDQNLLVPPDFVRNIERLEQVFEYAFKKEHLNSKIGSSIYENMKEIEFSMPCPCFPKQYLLKLCVRMKIYFTLKSNNQEFRTSLNRGEYFSVSNLQVF